MHYRLYAKNNKHKMTRFQLPAFITMNDSMYEGQEVKEQEANFK